MDLVTFSFELKSLGYVLLNVTGTVVPNTVGETFCAVRILLDGVTSPSADPAGNQIVETSLAGSSSAGLSTFGSIATQEAFTNVSAGAHTVKVQGHFAGFDPTREPGCMFDSTAGAVRVRADIYSGFSGF